MTAAKYIVVLCYLYTSSDLYTLIKHSYVLISLDIATAFLKCMHAWNVMAEIK